jgi:ADP-ribose pyrophosphatase YjhB (NUDIX family)
MTRPVAAAIAVVMHARDVVLVQRRNPPDAGLWGYPGGRIEPGETIFAAALRELQEETGLVGCARRLLTPFDVFHRDDDGQLLGHFILLPVLCGWVSGSPQAASDALDAGWFDIDGLEHRQATLSPHVPALAHQALAQQAPP